MKKATRILNRLAQNVQYEVDDRQIKESMLKDIDALKAILDNIEGKNHDPDAQRHAYVPGRCIDGIEECAICTAPESHPLHNSK